MRVNCDERRHPAAAYPLARSATTPTRFEPTQNVGDDFLGSQTRGVDDLRIRCRPERRHRAGRIARVPLRYVPGKVGQANINPLFFQLLMTPHRARLGAGRQHHLQERRREKPRCPCRGRPRRAPAARAKSRCRFSSAVRTSGMAATFEAASPARSVRSSVADVGAVEQDALAGRGRREPHVQGRGDLGQRRARRRSRAGAARPRAPRADTARRCRGRCQPSLWASSAADRAFARAARAVDRDHGHGAPRHARSSPCDVEARGSRDVEEVRERRRDLGRVQDLDRRRARAGSRPRTTSRCDDRRGCRRCRRASGRRRCARRRAAPRPRCRRRRSARAMTAMRSRFLLAQLLGAADDRRAVRRRGRDEQDRKLVDRERHELGPARRCRAARSAATSISATGSAPTLRSLRSSMRAPISRRIVEQADARRVDADVLDQQAVARARGSRRR